MQRKLRLLFKEMFFYEGETQYTVLFPDQHRGDWMPYPDHVQQSLDMERLPLEMPNMKKLMQSGVTFTRTVTPSPLCNMITDPWGNNNLASQRQDIVHYLKSITNSES
ncbi:hypothetical protein M6D81_08465 [Paenibacillus sp. J5C_2022]|uniref:hypothetical protein n=1 Tax=Paenibacillus sp. J5C2022 TaxID=2977129 RepID=UPI0021CF90FC|nr:hypothetical protein [Paenibacillus sp. J5C2022]MCU6708750.1 hypothetical protein [Paenibacillus sp. J5C2022]